MALDRLDRIPALALLPGLGPRPPAPGAGVAKLYSPWLLRALGHFRIHPVTFGNRVSLYTHGRDAFAAMLDAIASARDHVNLETYIFQDDGIGRRFAEALARKAGEGVVVNLTVDAAGCWGVPDEFFEDMRARGVRVLVYNPVQPWRVRHGRWVLNRRNHRKILVVDGRAGFTGGINIGDEYDDAGGTPGRWKDTHIRIEGPAVRYLQRVFMGARWWKQRDVPVPEADYFPALPGAGNHAVRILPTNPIVGRPYVRIVLRRAIRTARKSIHATQGYFLPDERVLWSLRSAARRGVEIGLVAPSVTDHSLALNAGRSTYGRLMRRGVAIYELQGQLLHSKTVVVDGEWSILGSANMDIRSFRINHEVSVDVLGRDIGEQMEEVYRRDLALSKRIDPEAWARRPLGEKVKEHLCGLLRSVLG